ncbi:MAG: heme o synthase [Planctomycetes bacterium]|nr:heme o synthase [Planctomycetota bacterium]
MAVTPPIPTPPTAPDAPAGLGALVVELSKPGIVKMVTLSSAVGFVMAALVQPWTLGTLAVPGLACLVGTALSAAGANALNQVIEVERDARMLRTKGRPVPSGRMGEAAAGVSGIAMSLAGLFILCTLCNPWASLVSAVTIATYLFWYTPMKPVSPLATIVGAVPGALPPLIGWAAASEGHAYAGLLEPGGWTLFAIIFVWQIPHFLAIAWKFREDYAAGGHRVLPVVDPSGASTARSVVAWSLALVPISLVAVRTMPNRLGILYGAVALLAAGLMVVESVQLARVRSDANARRLFFASIIYLPVVLLGMVADAVLTAGVGTIGVG